MQRYYVYEMNSISNFDIDTRLASFNNLLVISATKKHSIVGNKNSKFTHIAFSDFWKNLQQFSAKCLSKSDLKYLLNNLIEDSFNYLKNCQNEIYEMFEILLLRDCKPVDVKDIQQDRKNIFELYNQFYEKVKSYNKPTYCDLIKSGLEKSTQAYQTIVFEGFTFFNDYQNFVFEKLKQNVVFLVNKSKMLIDTWLKDRLNNQFELIKVDDTNNGKFVEVGQKIFDSDKEIIDVDSLYIAQPFYNRDNEFRFIINQIVNSIDSFESVSHIKNCLNKNAIVLTQNFVKNAENINRITQNYGLFLDVVGDKIKHHYFSKDEYLSLNSKLPYNEQLKNFNKLIHLSINDSPKSLFDTQIGKFILTLYKIESKGLTTDNFLSALISCWYFADNKKQNIISEFNKIKSFFADKLSISEWLEQIKEIQVSKKAIQNNLNYIHHPFYSVDNKSLEYLANYLNFLGAILTKISKKNGKVKEHIIALLEALKENGLSKENEQYIIKEFEELLKFDNELSISNKYFADNFLALTEEYVSNNFNKSNLNLYAVSLENVYEFENVYVPMFEDDVYPRIIKNQFPFDDVNLKILRNNFDLPKNYSQDKNYSILLARHNFKNLFNFAKSKLVFTYSKFENGKENSISIFGKDLMRKVTYQEINQTATVSKENQTFVNNLIWCKEKLKQVSVNNLLVKFMCPKLFVALTNGMKACYTDDFLLKLYCKAIIVNEYFKKIANGEVVRIVDIENEFEKVFESVANEVLKNFPLFSQNDQNDLKISAKQAIQVNIVSKLKTSKFKPANTFTLTLGKQKQIKYKHYLIFAHETLVLTDLTNNRKTEFDISKSLDFLLSSSGGKQSDKKHFFEIVDDLFYADEYKDTLSMLNTLSFKLNTQLNNEKYYNDGVERIKQIIDSFGDFEYSNQGYQKTSYCKFCLLKDTCKAVHYDN